MAQKENQNLSRYTYEYIKKRILDCSILPGAPIDEKSLLDEIQVSKTPFREALLLLRNENLVELRPRAGFFAKMITEKDVEEVYSARKIIEPYAVIDALGMLDMSRMIALNNDWEATVDSGQCNHFQICDKDMIFHSFLVSSTGNSRLAKLFGSICQEGLRISIFNAIVKKNAEDYKVTREHHEKMIDSILKEDRKSIIKVYNLHLNFFMSSCIESIRKYNSDNK